MMKKTILAAAILLAFTATAQMKEGRIVYERTVQLPVRNFGDLDPEIAKQIPRTRTDQYEMLFGNQQSLWQILPSATGDGGEQTFGGGGVMIRFASGMNEISFTDFEKGTRADQREIMDRTYLVSDSIRKLNWKLSEETKTVLTYTCRKATSTRISTRYQMAMENGEIKRTPIVDTQSVVAWFTLDIPVPVGPEYNGQLPGAILELDIANGQTVYKAIELSPKVNTSKIKAPKEGKKITADEFQKEREKLMEEMRKNMGEGGNIRIRMQ